MSNPTAILTFVEWTHTGVVDKLAEYLASHPKARVVAITHTIGTEAPKKHYLTAVVEVREARSTAPGAGK